EKPDITTASDRITAAAREVLSSKNVKAALANKLIALGLALIFFAAGVDYFSHEDDIHKAIAGFAHDAGQHEFAEAVETFDKTMDDVKAGTVERLPLSVRDHLAGAAIALGVLAMGAGVWMKLK